MSRSKVLAMAVSALLTALAGCNTKTVVSGRVTYKNAAISKGDIHFIGAEGQSRSGVISGGTYTVEDPPVGKVKVAIAAVEMSDKKEAAPSLFEKQAPLAAAAPSSLIPSRFSDPEQSNLLYDIKRGKQTLDIDLKD